MTGSVLELRGVGKSYPGVDVLHDIDLTIDDHDLAAIVGPSGSGKSTLLSIMGTLERPTSGEVLVEGRAVSPMDDDELAGLRASRLGFVFQQFFLIEGMTALANVAHGLLYTGVSAAERTRLAREQLQQVGLGHRLEHRPEQLSGGERQRVAIARALVGDPALVLADEPTGNLDSASGEGVERLLLELHERGATIVVITHDHGLAARMPRRIEIHDGRIMPAARTRARPA